MLFLLKNENFYWKNFFSSEIVLNFIFLYYYSEFAKKKEKNIRATHVWQHHMCATFLFCVALTAFSLSIILSWERSHRDFSLFFCTFWSNINPQILFSLVCAVSQKVCLKFSFVNFANFYKIFLLKKINL